MRLSMFGVLTLFTILAAGSCSGSGVDPPSIASFSASSASLPYGGGQVTLAWSAAGATLIVIDGGVGDVTNQSTAMITVTETTTFTLIAVNASGCSQQSLTVEVAPPTRTPAIRSFTVDQPSLPVSGGRVTLAWQVDDAASLSIDGGVGDVTGKTSIQVPVAATTTFTLTATNPLGPTTAMTMVTVKVAATAPTINFFAATPDTMLLLGGELTLLWNTTDAQTVTIDHGIGDVTGETSKDVSITGTTTFTLTAQNAVTSTVLQTTVTVAVPSGSPSISAFNATPSSLPSGGGLVLLRWAQTDAQSLTIDNGVGSVLGQTAIVVPVTQGTQYKLTASNLHGTSQAVVLVSVAP